MIAATPKSDLAVIAGARPQVHETPRAAAHWVLHASLWLGATAMIGLAACGGDEASETVGGGTGTPPANTASSSGAGAACAGGLMACDDGCVDLTSDPENCGQCGVVCVGPANAGTSCVDGHCLPSACEAGFGECDGDPSTGCETDLRSDAANCGACGVSCPLGCAEGACVTISEIVAGADYTCALRSDGSVWCWGDNSFGQIGDGTQLARYTPTKVALDGPATQIACGRVAQKAHTCATLTSGKVQCWGANDKGQVAAVAQASVLEPKLVAGVQDVVQVAAGGRHTCVLGSNHQLRCWGANDDGQLGLGSDAPVKVTAPELVLGAYKHVAAGATHTCAITLDDHVACWGYGAHGQIGDGAKASRVSPTPVGGLDAAKQLALGDAFSCALLPNMEVRCWGSAEVGQIGYGSADDALAPTSPGLTTVERIAAGSDHVAALILGGAPYFWGSASHGKLGDGQSILSAYAPKAIAMSQVKQLALGMEHSCALLGASEVVCWGEGIDGQLGNGDIQASYAPVAVLWP